MTDDILVAVIGVAGVAVGALLQYMGTRKQADTDRNTESSRLLIEAQRQLDESARDRQLLWLWNRELVDAIWRQSAPPPPKAPEGLFQDNDDE